MATVTRWCGGRAAGRCLLLCACMGDGSTGKTQDAAGLDGTPLQGVSVTADYPITTSQWDLRQGIDTTLQEALDWIDAEAQASP